MNAKVILLIGLVALSVILPALSTVFQSGASLNSTGTPINKACLVYSKLPLSDEDTTFLANNFDLVVLNPDLLALRPDYAASIKTKNSGATILAYRELYTMYTGSNDWSVVNLHEDWFLHDINGDRIQSSQFGWYLMDPGNAEWQSHYVSNLNSFVLNGYDGLFADDVWNSLRTYGYFTNESNINSSDISRWHNDVLNMIEYVKANIDGKLLILNTDQLDGYDYVAAADGMMIETYAHATWEPSTYYSTYLLSQQLSYLSTISGMDKISWANSGVSDELTPQVLKYCYVMYLLGINGSKSYWSFNDWHSGDGSKGYYPIMDTNIGTPTASYYSNQNVYMRDFTKGKIILNPADNPETIDLGGNFWFLNNTKVDNLTIAGNSGEVLLNETVPTPTLTLSPDPSPSVPVLPTFFQSSSPNPSHSSGPSPVITPTASPHLSPTPTHTFGSSPNPSHSSGPSPVITPTASPHLSPTPTHTFSPIPTITPTSSPNSGFQLASIGILGLAAILGITVFTLVFAFRRHKLHWPF